MQPDPIAQTKEALRRSMRERLEALDAEADRETARRLADRVLDSAEVGRADRVFACLSFGAEVDTWDLIDRLLGRGCEVVVPRAVWSTRTLTVHRYPCELETLRFGLRQPAASVRQLDPSQIDETIDVALVLGLGFDRHGYRLGFGAGFFDRFLAGRRFPTLGLARAIQVLERVPVASHDVAMSGVITEHGRLGQVRIDPASDDDLPFLRQMLYAAVCWRSDVEHPGIDQTLVSPDLAKLLAGWGRSGDLAFVARASSGEPLGAVWARTWTPDDHSYGYVDSVTPELGIGVGVDHRGRGIGRRLVETLLDAAAIAGVERLSLSVEIDNPAARLYRRLGFEPIARVGNAWTMVTDLSRRRPVGLSNGSRAPRVL